MQVVDCAGTPEARGRAHGETLRGPIADALGRWAEATLTGLGAREPASIDAYCERFLGETALMQCARRVTPDLYAEMVGISEGSGQPLQRIAAYNLMDEQWWYDARPGAPPPGCSLIALPVPGGHLLAQNMDLPGHMDGSQVALRLSGPDLPATIVLSAAGLLGLTGANAAGVAVGVNTLLMLGHHASGLPVAFALRHALAARSRDEARARLIGADHASGQHYAVVSPDGVTSLECSAGERTEVRPSADGRLLHTNHPLASRDIDPTAQERLQRAGFASSSHRRLEWLRDHDGLLRSTDDVRAMFDNPQAPLCMRPRENGGSSTFASVLYELAVDLDVRMRAGIAGGAAWHSIAFNDFEGAA